MITQRSYPTTRLRRMRTDDPTRRLQRECRVSVDDLLLPSFVCAGDKIEEAIASMPLCNRLSIDRLVSQASQARELGIPGMLIFPVIDPSLKSPQGKEATNTEGLVQKAIAAIKREVPGILVFSDIALDPYTSHGQDGILDDRGQVDNDATIEVLAEQAISHAKAGADVVSPSDMMDGRIGVIRQRLDKAGFSNTRIMSYAAKYASALYGPFRDAVGSNAALAGGDKKSYQMDPANRREALREAEMDIGEGADMLLVKPGGFYLDVLSDIKSSFGMPTFVYQVSGEYSMIKAAAANGWIKERDVVLESLLAFKRAGADAIVSYYALQAAKWLREQN
jgi:porphobilinogen synthase